VRRTRYLTSGVAVGILGSAAAFLGAWLYRDAHLDGLLEDAFHKSLMTRTPTPADPWPACEDVPTWPE
jgi:hypothetical protein